MERSRSGRRTRLWGISGMVKRRMDPMRQENDLLNVMMMCMRYCTGRGGLFM